MDRDEHLAQVTGLPYSRTDAHIDEVLVDEGDAKLLQNAIARVLLMSDDAHIESLCVHITPGGHTAIADLCLSKSVERGIMLRITRTSL